VKYRKIKDYENYLITDTGFVYSLKKKKVLKFDLDGRGYKRVWLYNKTNKKKMRVNRLVAVTFIPNPLNLSDVNHIDEDKDNNNKSNLEWLSHKENCNYGNRNKKISEARRK